MKNIVFALLYAYLSLQGAQCAHAQGMGTSTLNAAGGYGIINGCTFSWSVGEMTRINTIASPAMVVTEGVLQPPHTGSGVINGLTYLCSGSTITLTDSVAGGTWSSTFTSKATVTQAGVVTGLLQGVDTIKYTVNGFTAKKTITVYDLPAINAGTDVSICPGTAATLTGMGGTSYSWSPSGGLSCTACATPIASPSVTTSYILTGTKTTCVRKDTVVITVSSLPNAGAIAGASAGAVGSTVILNNPTGTAGGTWISSNPSIATVSSAGVVTGLAAGTDTILYRVTNACGTSVAVKVVAFANAGAITGLNYICVGSLVALTNATATPGGVWSSVFTAKATVSPTGLVTGIAQGVDTIKYTVNGQVAKFTITVYALPVISAGADAGISPGQAITLTGAGGTSYAWSPAAGLSCTTCASPVASPSVTTAYILTGTKTTCISKDTVVVTVKKSNAKDLGPAGGGEIMPAQAREFKVYPNPVRNELNIEVETDDESVLVYLVDVAGRRVAAIADLKKVSGPQRVAYNTAPFARGIYYIHAVLGERVLIQKVVLE